MKKAIRIRTLSQWHLLKQFNCYLGKKKIPREVMKKIYYLLESGQLGKKGFLVLCIEDIYDDCMELEEAVNLYPYRCCWEERIDEVHTKKGNREKCWYVSYARIKGQKTRVAVVYTTKGTI